MKKALTLAKELDFKTVEQYFEYCIESYINGNKEQCKKLFFDMKQEDKKLLLKYIIANYNYCDWYKFYFDLL